MTIYKHPIKAVIFDADGTLLDTIPIYWDANTQVMGQTYPPSFQTKVNGVADTKEAQTIIEHFGLKMTPEEFVQKRIEILKNTLPKSKLVAGVEVVARKIHNMNIPMAVATSSHREAYEKKISNHKEFFTLFHVAICGNEVQHAKPDPEIFQLAARRLGDFKPENVLIFEDAGFGIKAANAGGFPSVLLSTTEGEGLNDVIERLDIHPNVIIDHFADFDFSQFEWDAK